MSALQRIKAVLLENIAAGNTPSFVEDDYGDEVIRNCRYNDRQDKEDFIGLLLPSYELTPLIEGMLAWDLIPRSPLLMDAERELEDVSTMKAFIYWLQRTHDEHVQAHGRDRLDLLRTNTEELFRRQPWYGAA